MERELQEENLGLVESLRKIKIKNALNDKYKDNYEFVEYNMNPNIAVFI